jgi:long-chain acyl-CoA synthetase
MQAHDLLIRAEALYGPRPAIVDGALRYTYAAFAQRTRRLATALRGLGLSGGDVVACLSANTHRMMEAAFAASLAGLALAPVNTRLAAPEIEFILKDSGARLLFVSRAFLPLVERIVRQVPALRHVVVLDGLDRPGPDIPGSKIPGADIPGTDIPGTDIPGSDIPSWGGHGAWLDYETLIAASYPWADAPADWPAERMYLLCYTGGTTGRPKGVMLSQHNVLSNALHAIQIMELSGRDVWLHAAPMFHLADLWACFSITALGARHVFMERFNPGQALALIEAHGITATSIVPTMVMMLLEDPALHTRKLTSLRRVLYGASPMPVAPLKAAIQRFGPILQQAYGQTESAPFLAHTPTTDLGFPATEAGLGRLASCGQAVLGVDLRIERPLGGACGPGEVGEIHARGPNVMLGYWRRPEETRAALAEGWLRTGDLAYRDEEGYIFIVDRAKDVVISGGENIFSTEVENALYRHPAVLEAAVIGRPDERWGEAVHAAVVLRPGASATADALIAHCQALIARYKCPRTVEFRAELPKSGAGKILKAELRRAIRPHTGQ